MKKLLTLTIFASLALLTGCEAELSQYFAAFGGAGGTDQVCNQSFFNAINVSCS